MRLKGSMTIEAAYIFPFLVFLVAAIIALDFKLYDSLLSDTYKILGGMRYRQSEMFYYDINDQGIDYQRIACSPVLSEDKTFISNQKLLINKSVTELYIEGRLSSQNDLSSTAIDDVITAEDNANIVRAGGKVMEIIGG